MTIKVTDTVISSDVTPAIAEFRPNAAADGGGAWVMFGATNRLLTRDEAIEAVQHAEQEAGR